MIDRHMILRMNKPASSNRPVNSSENNFPEFFIPYMDFNNLKALPKHFEYYGNQSAYLLSNFTNTMFLTFDCNNAQMKSK